jgi:hypothetical protein
MSDDVSRALNEAGETAKQTVDEATRLLTDAADQGAAAVADANAAASTAAEGAKSAASTAPNAIDDFVAEASKVGSQVADSAKGVWESEQRKELQDSVVRSVNSVASAVEEQVRRLAETEEMKKFIGKVEEATNKVVESARTSETLSEAAETVMRGLSAAALSIEKWLNQEKVNTAPPSTPSAPPAPKPVDKDEAQSIFIERKDE